MAGRQAAPCAQFAKSRLYPAYQIHAAFIPGQMGLAQAYAAHAFTMAGEVADVMRLARLVNIVESYLFPNIINRRIMTDIPAPQLCFLRTYARIAWGFLTFKYRISA